MKKLIATIAAFTVALGAAFAQDLAAVTEVYNAGAEAVSTDKAAALKSFEEALKLAEALGDEGQEIVANCKNIIPNIRMSLAKDLVKESKFDEAVAALQEVEKVAEAYEAFDVADEAKTLVPQVKMSHAGNLLNGAESLSVLTGKPWLWVPAGTVIVLLVVCINFVGDALRDAFDPRNS